MHHHIKLITCFICLYTLISFTEWFIHKYIMHNNKLDPSHIRHHISVNKNMKLNPQKFVQKDIKMGTNHTFLITLFTFFSFNFIINRVFNFKVYQNKILFFSLSLAIFYHQFWNKYHRKMHFEPQYFKKTKNKYFKWMFNNHAIHHLQKGDRKGNYNIIFPGGDWLMGDYRTDIDNTEYCKDKNNRINSKDICDYMKKFKDIPI